MTDNQEKYFFLYLRTGGGHLAPARAVADHLANTGVTNIKPVLVDGLYEAPGYARFIIEDGYRLLQNWAKWFYELLYASHKIPAVARYISGLTSGRVKPYLKKRILAERPSKIVIFHFFLIEPVYEILKETGLDIPVMTVVTDPFTAHPLWFIEKDQNFIVFSERLKRYAVKQNIPRNNVHVFPMILDEKYSHPLPASVIPELKKKYNFPVTSKMVLIVGGGDGIPKGARILHRIIQHISLTQVVIVCGRNKPLFNYAQRLKKKKNYSNLTVYGYVDFIFELLNMSDLVITKCGASTFMEILMTRKIPLVNSYMWEQEKGNMEFLVENHLGIFEKNISRLPRIINRLLSDEQYYNSFTDNIDKMELENGTASVAEFILNFQAGCK